MAEVILNQRQRRNALGHRISRETCVAWGLVTLVRVWYGAGCVGRFKVLSLPVCTSSVIQVCILAVWTSYQKRCVRGSYSNVKLSSGGTSARLPIVDLRLLQRQ